jgi:hypothetical protein
MQRILDERPVGDSILTFGRERLLISAHQCSSVVITFGRERLLISAHQW